MTIDELIKSLQEAKQTYGNINVRVCDTDDVAHNITDISALEERIPKDDCEDEWEDTGRKELILWTT